MLCDCCIPVWLHLYFAIEYASPLFILLPQGGLCFVIVADLCIFTYILPLNVLHLFFFVFCCFFLFLVRAVLRYFGIPVHLHLYFAIECPINIYIRDSYGQNLGIYPIRVLNGPNIGVSAHIKPIQVPYW